MNIPLNDPDFSLEHITCLNFSGILTDHGLGCPKVSRIARPVYNLHMYTYIYIFFFSFV